MTFTEIVILSLAFHVCLCGGTNLHFLKERVKNLERRMAEDIALLRQEMYEEFNIFRKDNLSYIGNDDQPLSTLINSESIDEKIQEKIEMIESEVSSKLRSLQQGLQQEKRVTRDLQGKFETFIQHSQEKEEKMENTLKNLSCNLSESISVLTAEFTKEMRAIVSEMRTQTNEATSFSKQPFSDCADILRHGHYTSGVYTVYPTSVWRPLQVYCDMTTEGGGWTVFQRRKDGSENFDRPWLDYTFGFGNLEGEFWLGNEFIYRLTSVAPHELRVELEDFSNDRRVAEYKLFAIGSADDSFRLSVQYFQGNVPDDLSASHNGHEFSTKDKGASSSCSQSYKGGFWYSNCHRVNINGLYLKGNHTTYADGVNWHGFRGYHYSLKFTEMKFRSK